MKIPAELENYYKNNLDDEVVQATLRHLIDVNEDKEEKYFQQFHPPRNRR